MSDVASSARSDVVVEGQRAHVCVLFSDVCDYTGLNEATDPEDADSLRREIEELASRVIRKHRGVISQFYGDGILAVFGFPAPEEDDARRVVEAALELHEATSSARWSDALPAGFEVRMHSGIHAGLVFGRQGDALHGRYELTGDTVITAARLCGVAGRNEILVSGAALRGIEGFFATEPAQPIVLKGKKEPVSVHCVTGRSNVRTRFEARSRRGLTGFAGRNHELSQLMHILQQAVDVRGQLVVVTGTAGIGKTRLLEEFRARATEADTTVLHGCCDSYGEIAPLEPFVQVLRQALRLEAAVPADDAVLAVETELTRWGGPIGEHLQTYLRLLALAPWPASSRELEEAMHGVADALTRLVEVLTAHRPLVLVLDDWQWADDTSRNVLARVYETFAGARVCIVVGMRAFSASDGTLQPCRVLQLPPFTEEESAQLVKALRPRDFDSGLTSTLHVRSGGNPLFLEELCRSLPESQQGGAYALERATVPATVQGVIQSRVALLPAHELELLRVAAVIGIEFSRSLLTCTMQTERIDATLESLIGQDLIYAGSSVGVFRFKHGIAREVIYESVRIGERRRIHYSIAAAIERSAAGSLADHTEALAYHHRCAGDHEQAATYAELAGNKAMAASSLDRARFHYAAALAALDKLPGSRERKRRWLTISAKWAGPCSYSPARDQLETLARAAAYASELGDTDARARNSHWLGWFHYVLGEYDECIKAYEQAIAHAEATGNDKLLAQSWSSLGQSHGAAGEYREAFAWLARGLELKRSRAREPGGRAMALGFAHALGCRGVMHSDLGDFEAADRDFSDALEIVAGTGHAMEASVLSQRSIVEIRRGQWQAGAETAAIARETAKRVNSTYVFAMSTLFEAYGNWMLRGSVDSLTSMRSALDWLETRGLGLYISFAYGCVTEALFVAGDIEGAKLYAQRALARAARRDPLGEAMAYRTLARIEAQLVPVERMRVDEHLHGAFRSAEARGSQREAALNRLCVAELAERNGTPEAARASAEEARAELERMGMPWYEERARRLLRHS